MSHIFELLCKSCDSRNSKLESSLNCLSARSSKRITHSKRESKNILHVHPHKSWPGDCAILTYTHTYVCHCDCQTDQICVYPRPVILIGEIDYIPSNTQKKNQRVKHYRIKAYQQRGSHKIRHPKAAISHVKPTICRVLLFFVCKRTPRKQSYIAK